MVKAVKFDPGPSPFVPGALVAVGDGRRPWLRAKVRKVYANGNFVLDSEDHVVARAQWRRAGDAAWRVGGGAYDASQVRPWTRALERENAELIAARNHFVRAAAISRLFAAPEKLDRGFVVRFAKMIGAEAVVALGTKP